MPSCRVASSRVQGLNFFPFFRDLASGISSVFWLALFTAMINPHWTDSSRPNPPLGVGVLVAMPELRHRLAGIGLGIAPRCSCPFLLLDHLVQQTLVHKHDNVSILSATGRGNSSATPSGKPAEYWDSGNHLPVKATTEVATLACAFSFSFAALLLAPDFFVGVPFPLPFCCSCSSLVLSRFVGGAISTGMASMRP